MAHVCTMGHAYIFLNQTNRCAIPPPPQRNFNRNGRMIKITVTSADKKNLDSFSVLSSPCSKHPRWKGSNGWVLSSHHKNVYAIEQERDGVRTVTLAVFFRAWHTFWMRRVKTTGPSFLWPPRAPKLLPAKRRHFLVCSIGHWSRGDI